MKEWEEPTLERLALEETKYGGRSEGNYDFLWMDDDGKLHGTSCCS